MRDLNIEIVISKESIIKAKLETNNTSEVLDAFVDFLNEQGLEVGLYSCD